MGDGCLVFNASLTGERNPQTRNFWLFLSETLLICLFVILINWSSESKFFLLQALLHSLLIYWFVFVDGLVKVAASYLFPPEIIE